jgi:hypothetical protein
MPSQPFCWLTAVWLALGALGDAAQSFPKHWGNPPAIQTRDLVALPGGYGHGSTTLANWIRQNLERDAAGKTESRGVAIGKGVRAMGELRQGSRVTFLIEPPAGKAESSRVSIRLRHRSGTPEQVIHAERPPGRPAAAGGWVAEFKPEKAGEWSYRVSFRESLAPDAAEVETRTGGFSIAPTE